MEKYDNNLLFEINKRIRQVDENNDFVIYVKNVKRLRSGEVVYDFADNLNICSSHIIYKEKASVFSNDILTEMFLQNNISEIEMIGIDGNSCIESSAIDACKLGYTVVLRCKYIGVQNIGRFEQKKESLIKQGVTIYK